MKFEELQEKIMQARDLGVSEIVVEGITYRVTPSFIAPPKEVPDVAAKDLIAPLSTFDEPTDEEVLYWSTPYYEELQARKEAQTKQKTEDQAFRKSVEEK